MSDIWELERDDDAHAASIHAATQKFKAKNVRLKERVQGLEEEITELRGLMRDSERAFEECGKAIDRAEKAEARLAQAENTIRQIGKEANVSQSASKNIMCCQFERIEDLVYAFLHPEQEQEKNNANQNN